MHVGDIHRKAVARANAETFAEFKVHGPYEPGSKEHEYWLRMYDIWRDKVGGKDEHRL